MSGPAIELFARGRLDALEAGTLARLLSRGTDADAARGAGAETAAGASGSGSPPGGGAVGAPSASERAAVAAIIADVRARGDRALRALAERYDRVRLDALEVPRAAWDEALGSTPADVRRALGRAADNIARFHRAQVPEELSLETEPGVRLTRVWTPLERVGVYAPGGRAAYPSSVLMGVVPARAVGVGEVVVCSPPGPSGLPPREVLAACAVAGADRLFALGGAGAVAAMAFGTETVPAVDAIVGPGNRWVTEAKRQVAGVVPIDGPAGPSEVLVLADDTADPALVAHEMLAQAEHDPDAACVLVTTSERVAAGAEEALARLLAGAPREDVARAALRAAGGILVAGDLDRAVDFARLYAPEHLSVMTEGAASVARRVPTAGTAFVGASASVALGDYLTGANHVLPTGGRARSWSGLAAHQLMRARTIQEVDAAAAAAMAEDVGVLARAEGLPAHADAALARGGRRHAGTAGERPGSTATAGGARPPGIAGGARRPAAPRARGFPRPDYRSLVPYAPDRRPVEVDLSDNTNLWGTHPDALERVRAADASDLARYPTPYADRLRGAVSRRYGVDAACVTTGAGSDDVLDSAFRAAAAPGARIAFPGPTFSMVRTLAGMNGLDVHEVPWARAIAAPERLLEGDPALVYVCRPDNPTGRLAPARWVERLLELAGGDGPLVVVDEAYAEFADETFLPRAPLHPRLLVVRTASKAYGLAGLRCGYGVASAEVAAEVEKSRGPYKVSRLADAASAAALLDRSGWMERTVRACRENRARLTAALETRGLEPLPSRANFVLFRAPSGSAERDQAALGERGVALRPFSGVPPLGEALRVSVGPWPLLERFLEALDDVRRSGPADLRARGTAGDRARPRVALFDYGAGNLHSLAKALVVAGADVRTTTSWDEALALDALVLPGVGAFGQAARSLPADRERVRAALAAGHPCLGICLGMQLLLEGSEESPGAGLGLVPGRVVVLRGRVVPQMGWNDVENSADPLFAGMGPLVAYYANSYVCAPERDEVAIAWSEHEGRRYVAALRHANTWGVQFHPEKSSAAGLAILERFVEEARRVSRGGASAGDGGAPEPRGRGASPARGPVAPPAAAVPSGGTP